MSSDTTPADRCTNCAFGARPCRQCRDRARLVKVEGERDALAAEVAALKARLERATYFEWKDAAGVYWTISCPSWRATPSEWSVCREIRQIGHRLTFEEAWSAAEAHAAAQAAERKGGART
jgi:hypothetical protein